MHIEKFHSMCRWDLVIYVRTYRMATKTKRTRSLLTWQFRMLEQLKCFAKEIIEFNECRLYENADSIGLWDYILYERLLKLIFKINDFYANFARFRDAKSGKKQVQFAWTPALIIKWQWNFQVCHDLKCSTTWQFHQ